VVVQSSAIAEVGSEARCIGRIPVRNLWLLLLYASSLYRHRTDRSRLAAEENPDEIPDLVAEILAHHVERRRRRNLTFGYHSREAVVGRVRGRIDLLRTESGRLLDRGAVACRFEELTVDTARNRYVRAALDEIAKIVRRSDLAHRCRSLAGSLCRMGVASGKPSRSDLSVDRFGRQDADDRQMVSAAHLAFDLAMPTESAGSLHQSLPDHEITWVRKVYEKGVAGFYEVALSGSSWRVDAGRTIRWQIEGKTSGIDQILPSMRTDIVLENCSAGQRLVIDTKFNAMLTRGWYRDETVRSGYVYQIYAYLRSQERMTDPLSANASGMLLHPAVGAMLDESVVIQGHTIRFATVDLAADAMEIRAQLLRLVASDQAIGSH
jgi:5-methylcytosine-specific restriction enzyme subunit McrC